MNLSMLETEFNLQFENTGQTSKFTAECSKALFEAVSYSLEHRSGPHAMPCIVNNGTGTGKTTTCLELIATLHRAIPGYSAAFCVATIDEAHVVYNTLIQLLPEGVAIHTSAHQESEASKIENSMIREHVATNGKSSISDLLSSPVIVCTHELWVREGVLDQDFGVRKHNGSYRTHVFLDEFPDTISTQDVAPADLDELADELVRFPEYQSASQIARTAGQKLRDRCGTTGRFAVPLILPECVSACNFDPLSGVIGVQF